MFKNIDLSLCDKFLMFKNIDLSLCDKFLMFKNIDLSLCGKFLMFKNIDLSLCGKFLMFKNIDLSLCGKFLILRISLHISVDDILGNLFINNPSVNIPFFLNFLIISPKLLQKCFLMVSSKFSFPRININVFIFLYLYTSVISNFPIFILLIFFVYVFKICREISTG